MIRCFQNTDGTFGGAHSCDMPGCENHSPIVGALQKPVDACELAALNLQCPRNGTCSGAHAGFHIGRTPDDPDYCPSHANARMDR